MREHKKMHPSDFPRTCKKLDVLLQVIQEFDMTLTPTHWEEVRTEFVTKIILPLAKKAAFNRHWQTRFYAAKSFSLIQLKGYDDIIKKLINDKVPLVCVAAISAVLANHSEVGINAMMEKIESKDWLAQSIYLQAFDQLSIEDRSYFEKKLVVIRDPAIRAIYYKILIKCSSVPIQWDITQDIHSDNMELKLAAIKFIFHMDREGAIPYLIDALSDPSWEVKLIALHRLSMLKAEQAIPQVIRCIKDPNGWVSISAAEALKNMGEKGEEALQSEDPALAKLSFDLTHIMNTWW